MQMNSWVELDYDERIHWLHAASRRYWARPVPRGPVRPPGAVIHLHGSVITDLPACFCAIGEAVNGPGGYFGDTLSGLAECARGGFGIAPPFTVIWHDYEISRSRLGRSELVRWLQRMGELGHLLPLEGTGAREGASVIPLPEADASAIGNITAALEDGGNKVEPA